MLPRSHAGAGDGLWKCSRGMLSFGFSLLNGDLFVWLLFAERRRQERQHTAYSYTERLLYIAKRYET